MKSLHLSAKLGIAGAALVLVSTTGLGFTVPAPAEQLPTVKVWHDPT